MRGNYVPLLADNRRMGSYRGDRRSVVHLESCRRLRTDATDAERRLWRMLRGRRFSGHKFRRQHELGPFILDFLCIDRGLVIEADGGQHFLPDGLERDRHRDGYLAARGLKVLRFTDREILLEPASVEAEIERWLGEAPSPRPSPRGRGGSAA